MYNSITISAQLLALADRLGFGKICSGEMRTNATGILWPGHSSTMEEQNEIRDNRSRIFDSIITENY